MNVTNQRWGIQRKEDGAWYGEYLATRVNPPVFAETGGVLSAELEFFALIISPWFGLDSVHVLETGITRKVEGEIVYCCVTPLIVC